MSRPENTSVKIQRPSNLLKGGAYSILIQGQAIPVQLVIAIVLARLLGPRDYGTYSFAYAAISFIQVMPLTGLDSLVVRFGAKYLAEDAEDKFRGLLSTTRNWTLAFAVITSLIVILGAHIPDAESLTAFAPAVLQSGVLLLLLLPLNTYFTAAIKSFDPGVIGQIPAAVIRPWSFLFLTLAAERLVAHGIDAIDAILLQGIAALLAVIYGGLALRRLRPKQHCSERNVSERQEWSKAILPFALVGGLMLINQQADLVMIGLLSGAVQVGVYKVSTSAANLVALPLTAANIFLAQRVSALHSTNAIAKLREILKKSVKLTFAVAAISASVLIFFGKYILSAAFGMRYVGAYFPMVILAIAQLTSVAFGSVVIALTMTGRQALAVRSSAVAAVSNIILCAALIPRLGAIGAALSAACSLVLWNTLMFLFARREIGINTTLFG